MVNIKLDRLVFPDTPAARERYEAPRSIDELRSKLGQTASLLDILERHQTAYEDLQGIEPGADDGEWYEDFLDENTEGTVEIQRAFEQFNLPALTLKRLRDMSGGERSRLANHFVYFVESTKYRAGVLGADGVDYEGQFKNYGFKSEEQAKQYARVLAKMTATIKEQPFFLYLEQQAGHQPRKGGRAELMRMQHSTNNEKTRHGGRSLFVYVDKQTDGLKTWFQATDDK